MDLFDSFGAKYSIKSQTAVTAFCKANIYVTVVCLYNALLLSNSKDLTFQKHKNIDIRYINLK